MIKVTAKCCSYNLQILTRDSVTVSVDGVVYFRINCPISSVANVSNAHSSTRLLAQTTLRNALGTKNLAELLSDREGISLSMQVSRNGGNIVYEQLQGIREVWMFNWPFFHLLSLILPVAKKLMVALRLNQRSHVPPKPLNFNSWRPKCNIHLRSWRAHFVVIWMKHNKEGFIWLEYLGFDILPGVSGWGYRSVGY